MSRWPPQALLVTQAGQGGDRGDRPGASPALAAVPPDVATVPPDVTATRQRYGRNSDLDVTLTTSRPGASPTLAGVPPDVAAVPPDVISTRQRHGRNSDLDHRADREPTGPPANCVRHLWHGASGTRCFRNTVLQEHGASGKGPASHPCHWPGSLPLSAAARPVLAGGKQHGYLSHSRSTGISCAAARRNTAAGRHRRCPQRLARKLIPGFSTAPSSRLPGFTAFAAQRVGAGHLPMRTGRCRGRLTARAAHIDIRELALWHTRPMAL